MPVQTIALTRTNWDHEVAVCHPGRNQFSDRIGKEQWFRHHRFYGTPWVRGGLP